ncbi:MAG: hypothetical protein K8W52_23300 [Deltaproteobacteria bacterium]|nr:hypothetical protein [Deltaproteobacteria bacterium]
MVRDERAIVGARILDDRRHRVDRHNAEPARVVAEMEVLPHAHQTEPRADVTDDRRGGYAAA